MAVLFTATHGMAAMAVTAPETGKRVKAHEGPSHRGTAAMAHPQAAPLAH